MIKAVAGRQVESDRDSLRQLYCREIERVFAELEFSVQRFQGQPVSLVTSHAADNLSVLARCYRSNTLPVHVLDVLLQHLLTLAGMFRQKLN